MLQRRQLSAALAVGTLGLACGGLRWASAQTAAPAARHIAIVARKFVFLPNQITLKLGEPVVLEFTAPEVVMGFFAPDLQLRAVIVPGEVAQLPFVPQRAGQFDFLCDIFCGDGHEGMNGTITVVA
ncbi:MAG: cupredoxin domain-containing protein [Leptothrix sp. (in: b-proteobacteria)]